MSVEQKKTIVPQSDPRRKNPLWCWNEKNGPLHFIPDMSSYYLTNALLTVSKSQLTDNVGHDWFARRPRMEDELSRRGHNVPPRRFDGLFVNVHRPDDVSSQFDVEEEIDPKEFLGDNSGTNKIRRTKLHGPKLDLIYDKLDEILLEIRKIRKSNK